MARPASDSNSSFNMSSAICVMDASSCLGTRLVKCLLKRGYTVHAATLQNYGESSFLNEVDCKDDEDDDDDDKIKKLKSFKWDPFDYHSIVDALKGCSALFYSFESPSDHSTCDLWHALSKTLAEKTAWALAMDRGVNMVSVNAGLVMDPDLTITNPYLKGAAEMYEDGVFVTVDLDFLVEAHICVYEEISTYGRYLCFNHIINQTQDAVKLANMLSPLPPSPQSLENDTKIIQQRISNKKLNKLMVECQPQINDLLANQEECL
ncbi:hypothetical protein HAX54_011847 [Datura stramonium]|uniref:Cinnamoyl-CoA reductase n=1 Tax=Datura stramonium TaxID=4076 RepID=A0ABS8RXA0_DATST|nr:hypothetical protein [Datura stramonium]